MAPVRSWSFPRTPAGIRKETYMPQVRLTLTSVKQAGEVYSKAKRIGAGMSETGG